MRKMMKCSTLECHSKAVAITVESSSGKNAYCIECAIKVVKQWGPESLVSLPNVESNLPWGRHLDVMTCKNCGVEYTERLIGLTGDCPRCRKVLPQYQIKLCPGCGKSYTESSIGKIRECRECFEPLPKE